jgi:RNA polymerase sigma-70 factor (ECF subfamily)
MNREVFRNTVFSKADRIYPLVMRLLRNESDAKDAIQEIMVKLWNKRKQLSSHPNMNGFIFLTARNHCLDILKKKKRAVVGFNDISIENLKATSPIHFEYQELKTHIENIIENCPIQHKEILILRDLDELEYKEIAALTELKVEHIRVILSRTRKYVQQELKKYYSYE